MGMDFKLQACNDNDEQIVVDDEEIHINKCHQKNIKSKGFSLGFDASNFGEVLTDPKHANLFSLISQELLKNQVWKFKTI